MTSIKDAEWKVRIFTFGDQFRFVAFTRDNIGVNFELYSFEGVYLNSILQLGFSKSSKNSELIWKRFVKVNGIKKWKLI